MEIRKAAMKRLNKRLSDRKAVLRAEASGEKGTHLDYRADGRGTVKKLPKN